MRRFVLAVLLAAAACSPRSRPPFRLGLLEPVPARVAAEARRGGLEIASAAPLGAATVPLGVSAASGLGEVAADWTELRFRTAQAAASGAAGIYFRLPVVSGGGDFLDYAEESQALDRVLRELVAVRPILERGAPLPAPLETSSGVRARAWRFSGRVYVLLVNEGDAPAPLSSESLVPWRALFAVRSDPRESLTPCGMRSCLASRGVLWLEGRLLPELRP